MEFNPFASGLGLSFNNNLEGATVRLCSTARKPIPPGSSSISSTTSTASTTKRLTIDEDGESATDYLSPALSSASSRPPCDCGEGLPSRIRCYVPLSIKTSEVCGCPEKGVFVNKDVAGGRLIFKIKKPFLNIVYDNLVDAENALKTCCDNCLVISNRYVKTVPKTDVRFRACEVCEVVYYCSKKCRDEAWDHHHKYECMVFDKLHTFGGPVGLEIVSTHRFRLMARLLLLRENGQISDSDWDEFKASKTDQDGDIKTKKFDIVARFTKWLCDSKIAKDEIVDLLHMMQDKLIVIKLPILKDFCEYDPAIPSLLLAGLTFDPFVTQIAHSCSPNAQCISEGQEVRVRALRPLKAGDEITFRWEHEGIASLEERRKELGLGIYMNEVDGSCGICPQYPPSLTDDLRARALELGKLDVSSNPLDVEILQKLTREMQSVEFSYDILPTRELHQQLARAHLFRPNITACLQVVLKIYYVIEPSTTPLLSLTERLSTLHTLFSILTLQEDGLLNAASLPPLYLKHQLNILVHLRSKISKHTEKCFGADSKVTKTEKDKFLSWIEELVFNAEERGTGFMYIPLEMSQGEQAKFVEGVNDLLAWAGIEAKSLDQLLS